MEFWVANRFSTEAITAGQEILLEGVKQKIKMVGGGGQKFTRIVGTIGR